MKQGIAVVVSAFLVFCFTGCGTSKSGITEKTKRVQLGGLNLDDKKVTESLFSKHKNDKAHTVDFKKVLADPEKYKGLILETTAQIADTEGVGWLTYSYLGSEQVALYTPGPMAEKEKKVHRALGDYGLVKMKFLCVGDNPGPPGTQRLVPTIGILFEVEVP